MIKPDAYKHMGKIVNAIQRSGFMIKWVRKPLQGALKLPAAQAVLWWTTLCHVCFAHQAATTLCHPRMHLSAHVFFQRPSPALASAWFASTWSPTLASAWFASAWSHGHPPTHTPTQHRPLPPQLCSNLRVCKLSREEAAAFYEVHRGKPFYDTLVSFMSSGRICAMELTGPDAIAAWRALLGPTDSDQARQVRVWMAHVLGVHLGSGMWGA